MMRPVFAGLGKYLRQTWVSRETIRVSEHFPAWLFYHFFGGMIMLVVAWFLTIWFPVAGLSIIATRTILGPLLSGYSYRDFIKKHDEGPKAEG